MNQNKRCTHCKCLVLSTFSKQKRRWNNMIPPLSINSLRTPLEDIMIDRRTIFEIHRMANEGSSVRKIAENLQLSRKTVKKYLKDPNPKKPVIKRANKLDSFKDEIKQLLEIDHSVSAVVIQQRIAELGFDGEITIIRNHLRKVRNTFKKKSFIRFESLPGQQCQIDWGKVFDSTTVATAIADRLVHSSEVLIIGGPSYRRKQK